MRPVIARADGADSRVVPSPADIRERSGAALKTVGEYLVGLNSRLE
jgi:hypothetical protein